jgi:hypothetical protein
MEELMKEYSSKEGVAYVNVSQQMLQNIFEDVAKLPVRMSASSPVQISASRSASASDIKKEIDVSAPEAFSSLSISKKNHASFVPSKTYSDFRNAFNKAKFEQYMETNKGNDHVIGYYQKKTGGKSNEIYVLRQQSNHFSVIYIKGDINIKYLNIYLQYIRSYLNKMETGDLLDNYQGSEDIFRRFRDQSMARLREHSFDLKTNQPNHEKLDSLLQQRVRKTLKEMKQEPDTIFVN